MMLLPMYHKRLECALFIPCSTALALSGAGALMQGACNHVAWSMEARMCLHELAQGAAEPTGLETLPADLN